MTAHLIHVGLADVCLLEFPCGVILIDAEIQEDQEHKLGPGPKGQLGSEARSYPGVYFLNLVRIHGFFRFA